MSSIAVNRNLTIGKAVKFGITSLIGGIIVTGLTYVLTEFMGLYYLLGILVSGAIAIATKFVVNAIWTFKN